MSAVGQVKKRKVQRRVSSGNTSKKIVLERVIGNTIGHNSAFDCNPVTGDIAYPAGCIVIIYNPKKNKQIRFISNKDNKPISCVCYSSNGKYLAVGESGHRPAVVVWDTTTWQILSEMRGHKFGISCAAFSPNLKYLVTVGFQHDGYLYLWDWRAQQTVACNKATTKIYSVSYAEDGTYFVTAGLRHIKFWYLDSTGNFKSADKGAARVPGTSGQIQLIEGRSGVLGTHRDSNFVDVTCGKGPASSYTYSVTSAGVLCLFSSNRLMEKWVNLKTAKAISLSVCDGIIACACADGVVRMFDHMTLEYINTLPRPRPIGKENVVLGGVASPNDTYPDALAVRLSADGQRITTVYTDRSLIVWDIRNPKKIGLSRSFMAHSACIWDIALCPDVGPLPEGSFVTCSADNTIRVWNLEDAGPGVSTSMSIDDVNASFSRSIYSKELVHTIFASDDYSIFKLQDTADVRGEAPVIGEGGIRCVAVRPDGCQIASGDKLGNLRVYDASTYSCVEFKEAHDAEVLTMDFSYPTASAENEGEQQFLLGTASRDRLVHIFDASRNYNLVATLDDHSSSITSLKFAGHGLKLLTCSADKSVVFRNISFGAPLSPPSSSSSASSPRTSASSAAVPTIKRYHQATVPYGTLYGLDIDATQKYAVVVGPKDKKFSIYDIADGKLKRPYKADSDAGEVLNVTMDPAGIYVATTCSNKVIHLYDFFSGECLARLTGHSELVTGVRFTRDCRRIITVAGDGCIFIWKLSTEFTKTIKDRLTEQNPTGKDDADVVTSTPAPGRQQKPAPTPPNLSPIAPSRTPAGDHTSALDDEDDAQNESVGDLPSSYFKSSLPSWAKGTPPGNQAASNGSDNSNINANTTKNPQGKWQRVDLRLHSDLDEEDRPMVKWSERIDRRLTIEPEPSMWAEITNTAHKSKKAPAGIIVGDGDDGVTTLSDMYTDNDPKRQNLASSIEDDDGVLFGDIDDELETIGVLEDDDADSVGNESNTDQEEVYYPAAVASGDDHHSRTGFDVEAKSEHRPPSGTDTEDALTSDQPATTTTTEHEEGSNTTALASQLDSDLGTFHDIHKSNMLRANYENHQQDYPRNPLRLSLSRNFLNNQNPTQRTSSGSSKEPFAKDLEKMREILAKRERNVAVDPTIATPTSPTYTPTTNNQTPAATTIITTEADSDNDDKPLSGDVSLSTTHAHLQTTHTLPRPVSEYEQAIKNLSTAFCASMALFTEIQEVGGTSTDPAASQLQTEFSSLFSSLQAQLGEARVSLESMPASLHSSQQTQFDHTQTQDVDTATKDSNNSSNNSNSNNNNYNNNNDYNLERYSDMLVDRVMQKLGSLDFSTKLLQSIQSSQSISSSTRPAYHSESMEGSMKG